MNGLLYEHDDGRMRVAIGPATFAAGDPAWHRVGPVEVDDPVRPVPTGPTEEMIDAGIVANDKRPPPAADRSPLHPSQGCV